MTALAALDWILIACGGAAVMSLVRAPLRLEERVALALVLGIAGSTICAFVLAVAFGLRTATVLGGPGLLAAVALAAALPAGDPRTPWRDSLREAGARLRARQLWPVLSLTTAAAVGFAVLFAHALYVKGGSIDAGFGTVWADWSLHATTATSFAVAHNVPPHDPLFSGTALLYPFLPDFNSATFLVLGAALPAALAVPAVILCTATAVLVVSLAERLTGSFAAAVVAMAVCLLGGGLGFVGVFTDGCSAAGYSSTQCSGQYLVGHLLSAPGIVAHALAQVPGVVGAQTHSYDGLFATAATAPFSDQQWYTPLLAWWLPQRTFVYGFAIAVGALLLVHVGTREETRSWSPFVVAGIAAGALTVFHPHSLIALVIALAIYALLRRRREWLAFFAAAAVAAAPRVIEIAAGPHGSAAAGNSFPWLLPGWLWQPSAGRRLPFDAGGVAGALGHDVTLLVTPGFWGFWVLNCGVLVPLGVVTLLAALAPRRRWPRLAAIAGRVRAGFGSEAVAFCVPFMAVFAAANLVVFQSWDWDNTKLLVYWYLAMALLAGGLVASWWRRRGWRRVVGTLGITTVLLTGAVSMLRYLPWTPTADSVGDYQWQSPADQAVAAAVARLTPAGAVFLTGGATGDDGGGRPGDPLLDLAGRTAVLGYYGWLWSYGTDFGTRLEDVARIYSGCAATPPPDCSVPSLLRRYDVSFVEVDRRQDAGVDVAWWKSAYPVLVANGDITVYDVRGAPRA